MNSLAIIGNNGKEQIPTEEIIYLQADINYTNVHTTHRTKYTLSLTLCKVENLIAGNDFLRINRGLSINRNYLQSVSDLKKEAYVTMKNGLILPISRRKFNEVKKKINTSP